MCTWAYSRAIRCVSLSSMHLHTLFEDPLYYYVFINTVYRFPI
jgi:hypothetical protein